MFKNNVKSEVIYVSAVIQKTTVVKSMFICIICVVAWENIFYYT